MCVCVFVSINEYEMSVNNGVIHIASVSLCE